MNDFEIISANEAYKMTTDSIDKDNSVLKPIMEKIKKAINMKEYHCYIDGSTPEIILNKLVNRGYKVQLIKADPRDPRESDIYKVTWK